MGRAYTGWPVSSGRLRLYLEKQFGPEYFEKQLREADELRPDQVGRNKWTKIDFK